MRRNEDVTPAVRMTVLRMLRDGCTRQAIARRGGISSATVTAVIQQAALDYLAVLERERRQSELDELCDRGR